MTGFGFGKGPSLTDEQREVHKISADETLALRARILELEAALKPFAVLITLGAAETDQWMFRSADIRAARAAYLEEKK
jgi:hypothetical protein